jgi:hypothetical protein
LEKSEIKQWLDVNNIPFGEHLFKHELLNLAKDKKKKRFVVDEIANEFGHRVLRLPPYHCQFNSIEEIWGLSKRYYNSHMGRDGYGDHKVLEMWTEALNSITEEIWKNTIRRTENTIKNWWNRERYICESECDNLIINLNASDSDDSPDSEVDSD